MREAREYPRKYHREEASKAIEKDKWNPKGWIRKGVALVALDDHQSIRSRRSHNHIRSYKKALDIYEGQISAAILI